MGTVTAAPDPGRVTRPRRAASDEGFSLIEAIVAIALLSVGLLSLAAVFTVSLSRMTNSTWDILAKEKASEAIENILAARDEGRLAWEKINNTSVTDGVFVTGQKPLLAPGADRLINTADDDTATPSNLRRPGPDGQLLTADDEVIQLSQFKREIVITAVGGGGSLREVRVIITYSAGGMTRQFQMRSYLSSYAG
jgi:prepilin-type N-terminal cleavage/methylation domain-containing protein